MSDQSQGAGWWQASDSKWYPPESHPDHRPPPPPPQPTSQPAGAPAEQPIEVKGVTGTVIFDGHFVTIRRKKNEKRIPLRSITAVQMKQPSMGVRGFIQFTLPGGSEPGRKRGFGAQTVDAAKDENSVLFTKDQQPDFERLRAEIEARLA